MSALSSFAKQAGLDGVFTHFASNGFTDGARPALWSQIRTWCTSHGLLFVPTVAPGHDDRKIRPWNRVWRRERADGRYYDEMWAAAIDARADAVMINSYNDWSAGTQLEPVREAEEKAPSHAPQATSGRTTTRMGRKQTAAKVAPAPAPYLSFVPADKYLDATARHVKAFIESRSAEDRDEL